MLLRGIDDCFGTTFWVSLARFPPLVCGSYTSSKISEALRRLVIDFLFLTSFEILIISVDVYSTPHTLGAIKPINHAIRCRLRRGIVCTSNQIVRSCVSYSQRDFSAWDRVIPREIKGVLVEVTVRM